MMRQFGKYLIKKVSATDLLLQIKTDWVLVVRFDDLWWPFPSSRKTKVLLFGSISILSSCCFKHFGLKKGFEKNQDSHWGTLCSRFHQKNDESSFDDKVIASAHIPIENGWRMAVFYSMVLEGYVKTLLFNDSLDAADCITYRNNCDLYMNLIKRLMSFVITDSLMK